MVTLNLHSLNDIHGLADRLVVCMPKCYYNHRLSDSVTCTLNCTTTIAVLVGMNELHLQCFQQNHVSSIRYNTFDAIFFTSEFCYAL